MIEGKLRPARVLIDSQAIFNNVAHEVERLDTNTQLFAVVKADAYGHGLIPVAKIAAAAGASGFCVALLDEALALRAAAFKQPILVLGIIPAEQAKIAADNQISVTVGSKHWLEQAQPVLATATQPLCVHFGIDSGMGRIGFTETTELVAADTYLREQAANFKLEGIFTHFATADDPDTTYFQQQVARFKKFVAVLPQRPRYIHVANSATSLWHAACASNLVRFGVAMYGLNPSGHAIEVLPYQLQPALSLKTELTFVKQIPAGTHISYGATYAADQAEWIGTVPVGYADGWPRRMQGFKVLVAGQFCEIVGRVCMDQFMLRLPHEYAEGTEVVLVGQSGAQKITLQDVADYADTIHYEIACGFMPRLPRDYSEYRTDTVKK